jgi:phosphoglycerate dehydrogenase-like enzyme
MANEDVNVFFTLGPGPLVDEFWGQAAQRRAAELGFSVTLNPRSGPQPAEYWAEAFEPVDALITTWGAPRLDEQVLARNDTLKIVGHAAGSVAGIVSPALYERGVRVVNANAIMAQTVAEWCLMTTLVGWNRLLGYAGLGTAKAMDWQDRSLVRGMQDATIAIWGYGQISSHLIELLKPLGPREILVHSGHLTPQQAAEIGITLVEFDDLFARGDVIHLLGALTDRNVGKVGAAQLGTIREGAVLINAGRAALVEESALMEELRKDRFTAYLDVFYREPLAEDSPLRSLPNVVLSPHAAGKGREPMYVPHVLEEFDRFFRGEALVSEVAPDRAAMMTDGSLMSGKRRG